MNIASCINLSNHKVVHRNKHNTVCQPYSKKEMKNEERERTELKTMELTQRKQKGSKRNKQSLKFGTKKKLQRQERQTVPKNKE